MRKGFKIPTLLGAEGPLILISGAAAAAPVTRNLSRKGFQITGPFGPSYHESLAHNI